ncbi:MAG: acetylglutamate kinase [Fibrobacteria bacterium]|nr:acetylglutamate kinase [Fibrobacteria bacterium]
MNASPAPIVVKIGGSMAEDRASLVQLAADLASLHRSGSRIALVHGGGKDINRNLKWLDQEPRFVDGLRYTDSTAMDMVEMTLSGRVNKMLVKLLIAAGASACGVSGVDAGLMRATPLREDGQLGQVGSVTEVDSTLLDSLWLGGFLPVISPVSLGPDGESWNVNADDAAAALASRLRARALVYISDVPGVLEDGVRIPRLDEEGVEDLVARGIAKGGMIPKLRGCVQTLRAGVASVSVAGWSGPGSLEGILSGTSGTLLAL